ncbi:hypothetical protein BST63_10505 [Bradyrhizobium canariense]|uniref:Uncharacterized protein n=2 Tax=Nitrobacteraceae TaxID=41294 RepID=A0ABX3X659_9BRAD|nr:hypothetical protein BSR47_11755 [Bradyrhizobium canariense]OSJ31068.1 hypothetical protein BST63_10505 [Bradyrhizobium canariense]
MGSLPGDRPILYDNQRTIGRSLSMLASIMFGFVIVTLMMWCGRVTANFAAQRGRSRRIWFIWGALLFPLFPAQWFVLGLLPKK